MRTFFSILVLALLVPLVGCGKTFKDFKDFSPSDSDYTVLMPGKPNRETRSENGLTLTMYANEGWGEGYAVGSADIPPHTPCNLSGAVEGMSRAVEGTYRSEGSDQNGRGYREFEIEGRKPQRIVSGRVLMANGRLYMVFAYGKDARLSNPLVRRFIDSFRLNNGDTPGPAVARPNPAPQTGAVPAGPAGAPPLPTRPNTPTPTPAKPVAKNTIAGSSNDPQFRDESPDDGLLVGFDVWYGTFAGYDTVSAVRPIYRSEGATTDAESQIYGTKTGRGVRVIAKQGYAVGAVEVKTGLGIDSLTVTFMKITGERLNPNDAYAQKAGGPGGHTTTKLGGDGTQVIGIIGRKGTGLTGIGLAFAAR